MVSSMLTKLFYRHITTIYLQNIFVDKKKPVPVRNHSPFFPVYSLSLWICLVQTFCVTGVIQRAALCLHFFP